MSNRHAIIPVILGMNPPNKEVSVARTSKPLDGYAVIIRWADFPEGTQVGDVIPDDTDINTHGVAAWLQFATPDAMRMFGKMLIDCADGKQYRRGNVNDKRKAD